MPSKHKVPTTETHVKTTPPGDSPNGPGQQATHRSGPRPNYLDPRTPAPPANQVLGNSRQAQLNARSLSEAQAAVAHDQRHREELIRKNLRQTKTLQHPGSSQQSGAYVGIHIGLGDPTKVVGAKAGIMASHSTGNAVHFTLEVDDSKTYGGTGHAGGGISIPGGVDAGLKGEIHTQRTLFNAFDSVQHRADWNAESMLFEEQRRARTLNPIRTRLGGKPTRVHQDAEDALQLAQRPLQVGTAPEPLPAPPVKGTIDTTEMSVQVNAQALGLGGNYVATHYETEVTLVAPVWIPAAELTPKQQAALRSAMDGRVLHSAAGRVAPGIHPTVLDSAAVLFDPKRNVPMEALEVIAVQQALGKEFAYLDAVLKARAGGTDSGQLQLIQDHLAHDWNCTTLKDTLIRMHQTGETLLLTLDSFDQDQPRSEGMTSGTEPSGLGIASSHRALAAHLAILGSEQDQPLSARMPNGTEPSRLGIASYHRALVAHLASLGSDQDQPLSARTVDGTEPSGLGIASSHRALAAHLASLGSDQDQPLSARTANGTELPEVDIASSREALTAILENIRTRYGKEFGPKALSDLYAVQPMKQLIEGTRHEFTFNAGPPGIAGSCTLTIDNGKQAMPDPHRTGRFSVLSFAANAAISTTALAHTIPLIPDEQRGQVAKFLDTLHMPDADAAIGAGFIYSHREFEPAYARGVLTPEGQWMGGEKVEQQILNRTAGASVQGSPAFPVMPGVNIGLDLGGSSSRVVGLDPPQFGTDRVGRMVVHYLSLKGQTHQPNAPWDRMTADHGNTLLEMARKLTDPDSSTHIDARFWLNRSPGKSQLLKQFAETFPSGSIPTSTDDPKAAAVLAALEPIFEQIGKETSAVKARSSLVEPLKLRDIPSDVRGTQGLRTDERKRRGLGPVQRTGPKELEHSGNEDMER